MPGLTQDLWTSLMKNAPGIVIVVDRDNIIQYLNRSVPGLSGEEAIGKSQFDYIEPEHHDIVRKTIDKVFQTGEHDSYTIKGTGIDGGVSWYSSSVGPVERDGETVAVSIFTSDVSDRKNAEEDLKKSRDELLAQQSKAIAELSTPVIEIWEEILILPLIGTVDTHRAQQILENLLAAIVDKQAVAAILDVTGVPVIDTKVADHLLRTIEAAQMLGAKVILTGMSPYNAQALTMLGVDLSNVAAKGSLQQGLKSALEITEQKIVRLEPNSSHRHPVATE